jgi:predicted nucleic acid-binding protein
LIVQQPQQTLPVGQFPKLGAGEREAIPLAQELHATFLLMDDTDGRAEAVRRAIPITGTVGILATAAIRGLIDLPSVLAQLQGTTFHGSPRLFADTLARDIARKSNPSS